MNTTILNLIIYALLIMFTSGFFLAVSCYRRYKDEEAISLAPILLYEAVYYLVFPYVDQDVRQIYGRWGVLGLSVSIFLYLVWRHHNLRGGTWRFLNK